MSKKDRFTEIIKELCELFPNLDGVMIEGSKENPIKITITSQEEVLSSLEELEDYDTEDDEDDDGVLQ